MSKSSIIANISSSVMSIALDTFEAAVLIPEFGTLSWLACCGGAILT